MINVAVLNSTGEKVGDIGLKDEVFGVVPNQTALHQAVLRVLAGRRRGTSSTKTRGEVSGTTKKPWRQKGTGRARAGSTRSPVWRGGGIIFGPKPRDYSYSLPKKVRRLALRSALSEKLAADKLIVVDALEVPNGKTKEMVTALKAVNAMPNALVVVAEPDENLKRAIRNLPGAAVVTVSTLNPYLVLAYDKIILNRDAVARLEEVLT